MAYAVVRTDNLAGTDVRSALVSVKYMGADGTAETAIENGNVLKINNLVPGEREIYAGSDVIATDKINDIVLIASPEVIYDERKRNLDDYVNEAGKICRGYRLNSGGVFSVTKEALTGSGTPAVNDTIELVDGTKLGFAKTAASSSTIVGQIIDVEIAGRYTYYVIKVA